jgi:hypothetical protein
MGMVAISRERAIEIAEEHLHIAGRADAAPELRTWELALPTRQAPDARDPGNRRRAPDDRFYRDVEWVITGVRDAGDAWQITYDSRAHLESSDIGDVTPGLGPLLVYKGSGQVTDDESGSLIYGWELHVGLMDPVPSSLDRHAYLFALQTPDEIELCLHHCDRATSDWLAGIDSEFERITREDDRFKDLFPDQAGSGWWWGRVPSDPEVAERILREPHSPVVPRLLAAADLIPYQAQVVLFDPAGLDDLLTWGTGNEPVLSTDRALAVATAPDWDEATRVLRRVRAEVWEGEPTTEAGQLAPVVWRGVISVGDEGLLLGSVTGSDLRPVPAAPGSHSVEVRATPAEAPTFICVVFAR